jgi:hypothetical protein
MRFELEPFQDGFRTTNTREAVGFFHDGKAAFHLQAGVWVLGVGGTYAADKEGLPDAKLGSAEAIQNPFYKALALEVNHSGWIGLAMDQLLGRETGRVFDDEALAVAAGIRSPEQTAQTIENSWSKNRM